MRRLCFALFLPALLAGTASGLTPEGIVRVVFFGDSITELGVLPDGYITQMRRMLDSTAGAGPYELVGAGVGGNKVYDLYLRMEQDVLARNPAVVVIFVGVNDVWHKRTMGTGTDADKFVRFYEAILARLEKQGIRVILTTPACVGERTDESNDLDGELNHYSNLIRDVAARHSCRLVDLRKGFQAYNREHNPANAEKGILTTDGVHFSKAGNELAARLFLQALTQQ